MNSWKNCILKFTLFVLFIGHIRSLDSGENVYNKNFLVLESISDWEGFRQSNDLLTNLSNNEQINYFLIREKNNFDLVFKDNIYTSKIEKLNECQSKLNVTYSFDYFLDLNPKIKILKWTVNFLNEREDELQATTRKWSSKSNSVELSSLNELRENFTVNQIFKMQIKTADRYKLDDTKNEIRFAIKNLKLVFACESIESEHKFSLKNLTNSQFIFERNGAPQSNVQLIDNWSNSVFPKFISGTVDKYYFTEKSSRRLNFIITENDFEKEEEVCLTFDYFVTKNAILSVKFINRLLENRTLLKLYTSEFNERLINDQVSPKQIELKWNNATVCVKAEQILAIEKKPIPQWSFESFIHKPESKENIIAVTNFRAFRRMQNDLKNYIPNWKFNGEKAFQDWRIVPETPNFRFNLSKDHQLKLYLRELPSDSKRHYHVISDWFILDTDANYLTFKIDSNLSNYQITAKLNSDLIGTVDVKSWKLNGEIKNRLMQFDLKNARKHLEFNNRSKFRVVFEIDNNKPILQRRKMSDAVQDKKAFEKHPDEQILMISEIQLADKCTEELICNSRGNCESLAANKATCSCEKGWHGDKCEFENKCNSEINLKDFNKTGNEYCEKNGRLCLPHENSFKCECKDIEYWDSDLLECMEIDDCLFKACGLNEECTIKNSEAKCECKATFKKNEIGVCIKDLCSDPNKKCPKNQHCLHIENEVNPICYCPVGTYKKDAFDSECIDLRRKPLRRGEKPGPEINPFVLQHYECQQDYSIDEDGHVTCECLPGYKLTRNRRCESDFDTRSCGCNQNEICIQKDDTIACICKPGYFGDSCRENTCNGNRANDFCGTNGCHITDSDKFVCNCDKYLYNEGENGLCKTKDVCNEKSITCVEDAACIAQKSRSPFKDYFELKPQCACKHGLAPSKDESYCVDPCVANKHQCDHVQFSECKLEHQMNEIKCNCKPGMWRKGLTDPCTPSKSSLKINLVFLPKDTNVNPVHKKDNGKRQYLSIDKINNSFNLTRNENSKEKIREKKRSSRSVFRLTPSGLAFSRLATKWAINRTITNSDANSDVNSDANSDANSDVNSNANSGSNKVSYSRIYSVKSECHSSLDFEGCINQWNREYQAINTLPTGELSKNFVESMIRKSLLDTFNAIFDKKIESVIVVSFSPVTEFNVDNFGLKTFYNVNFLIQSNELDLEPEFVKDALNKKCVISQKAKENTICSIFPQSVLLLNSLEMEEYDVCETKELECPSYNECYNRRKDPEFDFKNDEVAFECRCKSGFKSVNVNELHFTHFLNHTCEDINECESPDLNECDETSTTCANTIGSYRCDCDSGYKRLNTTQCIELCSNSKCVNGECKIFGAHEDYCQCYDDWKGVNCTESNAKLSKYKITVIIIIVVSLIVLVLIVIGFVLYGRGYAEKKVDERVVSLKHELEMAKLESNQRPGSANETNIKHYSEGQTNPAFESHRN